MLCLCVAWFYHLKSGDDNIICFREFLWGPNIDNCKILSTQWLLAFDIIVFLLIQPCIRLWHGHKGPEGRGTDQIWRKSGGRKESEQEASGIFWKIPEDSGHLGKMRGGCRKESPSRSWFRGFPARVTFKLVEWPWTMTFLLTPPSCSISTFNWVKQT